MGRAITPAGRGVIAASLLGWYLGVRYHWDELEMLALLGAVLIASAAVSLLLPRASAGSFRLVPTRTVVGNPARVRATITAGALPLLNPVLRAPMGDQIVQTRLPIVRPRQRHEEVFELPARRRGVYQVGPLVRVQSDVLGLFRRFHEWATLAELHVRPRTVALQGLGAGVIHDLEGVPSGQLSPSDMAFHALREYVPGDDLRHVHWRSSAKADTLLVRQYLETRRSHATVLIDDDPSAYAHPDDFELAVSLAASVAVRTALDDFQVLLVCGANGVESHQPDALLDATCRFVLTDTDFAVRAMNTAAAVPGTSLVAVVTGGARPRAEAHVAASRFPSDALRLVLFADPDRASQLSEASGVTSVSIERLEHLPALLFRSRA